jgi:hypothetical protein
MFARITEKSDGAASGINDAAATVRGETPIPPHATALFVR